MPLQPLGILLQKFESVEDESIASGVIPPQDLLHQFCSFCHAQMSEGDRRRFLPQVRKVRSCQVEA